MIVTRRFRLQQSWPLIARSMGIGAIWASVVFLAYAYLELKFLRIPFLPLSTIGTAVAFYVGFKNNASYDRFWEGRKIWGGVVNTSRTFAVFVMSHIDAVEGGDEEALAKRKKTIVYRHLAWINALRMQLREKSRFLDATGFTEKRMKEHAAAMRMDWDAELSPFLSKAELAFVSERKNASTHLVAKQGEALAELQREGHINIFHHTAMTELLEEMYTLQGKCERIKNTPFPRQYAEFSRLFTNIFLFFVPFGLLDVFADNVKGFATMESILPVIPMVAASALITWVYLTFEGVGDASEDPFERSMNDVPMNALCRTIEIDLRELLGETQLPDKEPAAPIGNFEIMY